MKRPPYKFWIKERYNPQLGVYFVACGQISKAAARRLESPLYGNNLMYSFETEKEYNQRIADLKKIGARFA